MSRLNATMWMLGTFCLLPLGVLCAQDTPGPLLEPTGEWRVGRTTVEVVDASRSMPDGYSPRRLMLHIWYPASPDANGTTLPYMEHLEAAESSLADDEIALVKTVQTHSFTAAPAASPPTQFPLLLFSHVEQTNALLYSNLNEELASHGYVLIAVDHPGAALFSAYPDGTFVPYSEAGPNLRGRIADRARDLRFVLELVRELVPGGRPFEELVSARIGVLGHSAGGIAGALLCQQSPAVVDACLNLDGRLDGAPIMTGEGLSPPSTPFMYVAKPFRTLTEAELRAQGITRNQATSEQADTWVRDGRLLSNGGAPSYRVTVYKAKHESFSDEPLLREPGDENSVKLMRIVRDVVVEFFDTVLSPQRSFVASRSDEDVEIELLVPTRTR